MTPSIPPILHRSTDPWLLELVGSRANAYEFAFWARDDGITSRVLRGWKMKRLAEFFNEIGAAMQFPSYFGENGAALSECLTDLEWLPGAAYLIVVADAGSMLAAEDQGSLHAALEIFRDAAAEWAVPVEVGEAWDHPATPFHVVFQFEADAPRAAHERYAAAGANLHPLGPCTPAGSAE